MKLKKGVIISPMDGEFVAVASAEAGRAFSGMIRMNKTAAFIVERLQEETSVDALVEAMLDVYDVDEARARASIEGIVAELAKAGLLQ